MALSNQTVGKTIQYGTGGALAGGAIAGPPGAIIGGIGGAAYGFLSDALSGGGGGAPQAPTAGGVAIDPNEYNAQAAHHVTSQQTLGYQQQYAQIAPQYQQAVQMQQLAAAAYSKAVQSGNPGEILQAQQAVDQITTQVNALNDQMGQAREGYNRSVGADSANSLAGERAAQYDQGMGANDHAAPQMGNVTLGRVHYGEAPPPTQGTGSAMQGGQGAAAAGAYGRTVAGNPGSQYDMPRGPDDAAGLAARQAMNAPAGAGDTYIAAPQFATTQLDMTNANQSRGQQMQALGLTADAAAGNAPSAAQQQMVAGQEAQQRSALSLAAGARGGGGNQVAAMRNAINSNAAADQNVIQQSGILRAQEMATNRQAYNQAAYGIQQGDIGTAMQTGAFNLSQNAQKAGYDAAQAQFGATLDQNANFKQSDLDMGVGVQNSNLASTTIGQNDGYRIGAQGIYSGQQAADTAGHTAYQNAIIGQNTAIAGINAGVGATNVGAQTTANTVNQQAATATQNATIGAVGSFAANQAANSSTGRTTSQMATPSPAPASGTSTFNYAQPASTPYTNPTSPSTNY